MKQEKKKKERKKEIREKKEFDKRLTKDRVIRDIRTPFEQQQDYCEPKRVNSFSNNNYIKYESNGHKNRNLSLGKYLHTIKYTLLGEYNNWFWKFWYKENSINNWN